MSWLCRAALAPLASAALDKAEPGSTKPAHVSPTDMALCKAAFACSLRLSGTGVWKPDGCPTPYLHLPVRHLKCWWGSGRGGGAGAAHGCTSCSVLQGRERFLSSQEPGGTLQPAASGPGCWHTWEGCPDPQPSILSPSRVPTPLLPFHSRSWHFHTRHRPLHVLMRGQMHVTAR